MHPELKGAFSMLSPDFLRSLEDNILEARKSLEEIVKAIPQNASPSVNVTKKKIPSLNDAPQISVTIHKPKERNGQLPAVLWMHGGGFLFGSVDGCYLWCQRLVEEVKCMAVAVDYRLAPENPFPCGLEDCYATLVWMKDNAEELCIDANQIAVGGESAGGGLCAALSLLARDRGGPKICFQLPLFPMLDDQNVTQSSYEIIDYRLWNRQSNLLAWKLYLDNELSKEVSPYAAPAREINFSGLPATYTYIGDLDLFRDETIEYVKRLVQAGVPTEFHLYPGCFHGFELFASTAELTKTVTSRTINALKQTFKS